MGVEKFVSELDFPRDQLVTFPDGYGIDDVYATMISDFFRNKIDGEIILHLGSKENELAIRRGVLANNGNYLSITKDADPLKLLQTLPMNSVQYIITSFDLDTLEENDLIDFNLLLVTTARNHILSLENKDINKYLHNHSKFTTFNLFDDGVSQPVTSIIKTINSTGSYLFSKNEKVYFG